MKVQKYVREDGTNPYSLDAIAAVFIDSRSRLVWSWATSQALSGLMELANTKLIGNQGIEFTLFKTERN
ncbi:hypothetical protein NIES4071_21880 [Calothrix sp. NIES-4071]|nr:hypothetical protein NIES4071_21880 [Calothrix sp. NIES-4071]BAZ56520.1 hypothetical protein NIES4105_21830 [Calothrix sp. NIES-4105]